MTVPDWRLLSSERHSFTFLRREFLGEVRCVVFDVATFTNLGRAVPFRLTVPIEFGLESI